jgi:hypothetical protein
MLLVVNLAVVVSRHPSQAVEIGMESMPASTYLVGLKVISAPGDLEITRMEVTSTIC